MVSIQVSGQLRLLIDGKRISPGRPGARALLAWLVLHPGRHARDFVRDELDLSGERMRFAVHELKALKATGLLYVSQSDPKEIELVRDPARLTIDWDRLQAALKDSADDQEREKVYAAFVGRTLLTGLDNELTPDWLRVARERCQSQLVELCSTSAYEFEQRGDIRGALWWARARREIDPTETAVRSVMRLLALIGNHDQALVAAEEYLNAPPEHVSAEFREAVEELRRGESGVRREQPVLAEIPSGSGVELVGRTGVVEAIWKAVQRAKDERQIVLLIGEAGMGKTRVARAVGARLVAQSGAEGAALLYGYFGAQSPESGAHRGIAMALSGFLAHWKDPSVLHAQLGDDGPVLARLLPELRERLPSLPEAPPISLGTDRYQLKAAVTALLTRIAHGGPTIVVLDDLHYADQSSLDLLRHVIDATTAPGLLVLCTLRPDRGEPVASAVAGIIDDHEASTREIPLMPLGLDETRRLAQQHVGDHTLAEPDAERIHAESDGVPFRIEEVARNLDRDGAPLDEPSELDPAVERLLAVAAVIGFEFSLDTLSHVAEEPIDAVAARLAEVTGDPGIVAEHEPGRYRFTHGLRYENAARSTALDETQRRSLSRRAAAFEEVKGVPAARLARLWRQSGDVSREVQALMAAAAAAEDELAYEVAAAALDKALDLVGADDRERCELLLRRGSLLWNAGHFRASRAAFEQAAAAATDPVQLGEAALGYSGRLGFQGVTSGSTMTALQRRALAGLPDDDTPLRARLLACLGQALTFAGKQQHAEGAALCRDAEAIARRLASADPAHRDLLVDVLCRTCWATWTPDNLAERQRLADELVETAREIDRPVRLLESLVYRLCGEAEAGDFVATRADLTEAASLARKLRQPYYDALVRFAEGMFEMLALPARGEVSARQALDLGHRQEHPGVMQLFGVQVMYAYLQLNRAAELIPASRDLSACYPGFAAWRAGLALIYVESDMFAEAAEVAHELLAEGIPDDMFWLVSADHLARVVAALQAERKGEERWIEQLYTALKRYSARFVIVGGAVSVYSSVEHPLGLLAAAAGRSEEALERFARAQRRAAAIKCRAADADARVEIARLLLEGDYGTDQVGDAIAHLEQGIAMADECQLTRIASRATGFAHVAVAYADVTGQPDLAARARAVEARAKDVATRDLLPRQSAGRFATLAGPTVKRISERAGRHLARRSDAELEAFFVKPLVQKTVFDTMARSYRADRGLGFAGQIGFEIRLVTKPETQVRWRITVHEGSATAEPRMAVDPAVLIRITLRDFLGFFTRTLNGVQAWVDDKLEVDGDPVLAARLVEMFGGEAALVLIH